MIINPWLIYFIIPFEELKRNTINIVHENYYKGGLNMFYQGSIFQRSSITYLILVNNADDIYLS